MNVMFMSQENIREAVDNVAAQVTGRSTMIPDVVVPIMTGALFFSADLLRAIYPIVDPQVWPVKATRLPRVTAPGKFQVAIDHTASHMPGGVCGKRILLLDTVFDTGATVLALRRYYEGKQARSVQSAVLVWKNLPGTAGKPDYYGVDMQGRAEFLYGYGMDKNDIHRGCQGIYW